ncbi:MAG: hypothetical protein EOM87_04405 [Clostridia bacterium]|nr:hypothetical protein [Clostridia bacterium]
MKKSLSVTIIIMIIVFCLPSCRKSSDNIINGKALSDMTAKEMFNYSTEKLFSSDNFTCRISMKMYSDLYGYKGKTIGSELLKFENLNGDNPKMSADITIDSFLWMKAVMNVFYSDGYCCVDYCGPRLKTALTHEQAMHNMLSFVLSNEDTTAGDFKSIIKTNNGSEWTVTCSGMNNAKAEKVFGDIIKSFSLNLTGKIVEFNEINVITIIDPEGYIISQDIQFNMNIKSVGKEMNYTVIITAKYNDYGITTVYRNINTDNFSEVDYSDMFG